jgi:hypothetical protein
MRGLVGLAAGKKGPAGGGANYDGFVTVRPIPWLDSRVFIAC